MTSSSAPRLSLSCPIERKDPGRVAKDRNIGWDRIVSAAKLEFPYSTHHPSPTTTTLLLFSPRPGWKRWWFCNDESPTVDIRFRQRSDRFPNCTNRRACSSVPETTRLCSQDGHPRVHKRKLSFKSCGWGAQPQTEPISSKLGGVTRLEWGKREWTLRAIFEQRTKRRKSGSGDGDWKIWNWQRKSIVSRAIMKLILVLSPVQTQPLWLKNCILWYNPCVNPTNFGLVVHLN